MPGAFPKLKGKANELMMEMPYFLFHFISCLAQGILWSYLLYQPVLYMMAKDVSFISQAALFLLTYYL